MLTIIEPSTDTLVSLTDLKRHLAIEHDLDDERLTLLLENATQLIEADANCAITPQTWKQTQACFTIPLVVDKAPVIAAHIQYYNLANSLRTLDPSAFYVIRSAQDCRLSPVDCWPETYHRPDAVQVTIELGLASVPGAARQACLMKVAQWNEDREGTTQEAREYDRLINSIRVGRIC